MSHPASAVAHEGCSGLAAPRIDELLETDRAAWDEYVTRHPAGTFFHLSGWQQVLKRAFGHRSHYLVARSGATIVGVLPLARVRSMLFGDSLISTPFCVYGGALADGSEVERALEDHAAELGKRLGVDYVELRNRSAVRPDWPTKDLYYTFRKTLDADPEKNMLAIPRKQRAEVRQGMKHGLTVELDADSRRLFAIYSESVRNLGTPVFTPRYFDILREVFGSACEAATVVHQGQGVASLLTFWFRDEVLPYYGGGLERARAVSAYDFLYWDLMRRATERGVRTYDFGRSKLDTGPYRYKKHWGFEPQALPYAYHLVRRTTLPNLSPANPKYQRVVNLWKRLPLGLTRIVGPPLAKYLG